METSNAPVGSSSKVFFKTLWLSDIHLGSRDCHAAYLLHFLNHIECERLYLVGDIFDMLAMKRKVFWPQEHSDVVKQLYCMAQQQHTEIVYIPGNHDMPMRHFDQGLLLNVQLHRQFIHTTVDGKKLLVVHGDEFDHAVLYRAMNRLIGDPAYDLMVFLNRWFHRLRSIFGLPFWSLASYLKTNISQARATIEAFEQAAAMEARQRHLDGVVCGHIHQANLREIDGIMYCNDGDWTETCSALVEHNDGRLELMHWRDIENMIDQQQWSLGKAA
ncbi:UDP-2,3-diacylglucosamine diphosphatase [Oceanicoccus sp. KOV_DT_Chl]|uniref:UDP-2,3-diacylglucosamine diphosphatase n=1 Tax=Oceanicoccus sp. KOV_DT_Chl TaxID=1904639 RepID=UPI000C7AB011|nr:UDP-2,3-diacylglucosamine diphosphatase [Oceanicoccus sp. KOV_DT_Chl]